MRVHDAVQHKSANPEMIDASQTVADAVHQMRTHRVRSLIVTDNGRLVGVIDAGDVFRRLDEIGGDALDETVTVLVTKEAVTVAPDTLLSQVEKMFPEHRVNHVVVVDGGTVVGILTPADVLTRLLDHVEFLNQHLHDYVSSAGYSTPSG